MPESSRDKTIEVMAIALKKACGASLCRVERGDDGRRHNIVCRAPNGLCQCKFAAERALTAYESHLLPSEGRRLGLEEALQAVGQSAWKHAGSDAYSQGMDAGATHQLKASLQSLRSLIDRKE